jgi:quercetin dioxygenase-like cupin family protein
MTDNVDGECRVGYVSGNIEADAQRLGRGGWIVGVFFSGDPAESSRASQDLEVKYWSYGRGGGQSHRTKSSTTLEWSLILSGKVRAKLGNESVILNSGDYVLIHPNTPNNLVDEVLEDTVAVTIKSPSNPDAKTVLPS